MDDEDLDPDLLMIRDEHRNQLKKVNAAEQEAREKAEEASRERDELQVENEKLKAELERLKREHAKEKEDVSFCFILIAF